MAVRDTAGIADEPGTTKLNSRVIGGISSFGSASYEAQKQFDVPARRNIRNKISLRKMVAIPERAATRSPHYNHNVPGLYADEPLLIRAEVRLKEGTGSIGCCCAGIRSNSQGCIVKRGCACLSLCGGRGTRGGRGRSSNTCELLRVHECVELIHV